MTARETETTEDGRWYMGCCDPTCMSDLRVKNAGFRVVTPEGNTPCADCAAIPTIGPEGFQGDRPSIQTEMGGCGCGSSDVIDAAMLVYLSELQAAHDEVEVWRMAVPVGARMIVPPNDWYETRAHKWPYGMSDLECYLIAVIADTLGFTEHGGSIYGSWLTDDGTEALANLRAWA